MGVRILHIADVHLDRPFVGVASERRQHLRRRLLATLGQAVALAEQHRCDLLTIGGDLWEEENVTESTRRELAALLARTELPVAIVAGNHDPIVPGGSWERIDLPPNVRLFEPGKLTRWRPLEGSSAPTIWGISWGGGELHAAFLERPCARQEEGPNLLLLHGTAVGTTGREPADRHCPFELRAVHRAGFDLCLCGHIHRPALLAHEGRLAVVYPGSPFPLAFDETHSHGVVVVELDGPSVKAEGVPLGAPPCLYLEVDCEGVASRAELRERVARALAQQGAGGESDGGGFLTVALVGSCEAGLERDLEDLQAMLTQRFAGVRVIDRTQRSFDLDAITQLDTARGRFARSLRERIGQADGRDREVAELALEIGLRALDGGEPV